MQTNVLEDIAELKRMTGLELMDKWKRLIGGVPPSKNHTYMISRLTHRIQVLAYGDIKPETRRRLSKLREQIASGAPITHDNDRPPEGAVLVREYKGTDHKVKVLASGFEYEGITYKSLSAIARHITGTNWNGLVFFGLRRK